MLMDFNAKSERLYIYIETERCVFKDNTSEDKNIDKRREL